MYILILYNLYKTNRFHVAVRVFSDRSQMTSKCYKNISDTLGCALNAPLLFLPHNFSSVIYHWTDVRQHGIYSLNLHNVILADKCNTPVVLYETKKVIKWQGKYTVDLFHITYIHMYWYSRKLYLIDLYPPWGFSGPMKQTTEVNLTGEESQLARRRPIGFVQAQPWSWSRG